MVQRRGRLGRRGRGMLAVLGRKRRGKEC
jgi:hypothetical protein